MRILIAEDETIIRLELRWLLEERGFEVCGEARDGHEAVALASRQRPDLAIVDVRMPRLDGLSAVRKINAERPLPVVMLTGFHERDLPLQAAEAGAFAYLLKPFREQELLSAIEMATARHTQYTRPAALTAAAPLAPPPSRRKRQILEAAARLFAEKGYRATSIRDVADAVGVLKGSLYYYIDSKESLLLEVVGNRQEAAVALLEELRAVETDALATVREFCLESLKRPVECAPPGRLRRELVHLAAEERRPLEDGAARLERSLAEVLGEGRRLGSIRPDLEPETAARCVLAMLESLADAFREELLAGDLELPRAALELLLDGLASQAAIVRF